MRDGRRGKKIHLISPYSLKGRSSPHSPIFSTKVGRMGARDFRISWMGEEEEEKRPFKCGRKREGLRRKRRRRGRAPFAKISPYPILSSSLLLLPKTFRGGFSTLLAPSSSSSFRPNFRQFPSLLLSQEKKKRRPFPPSYSSSFVRGFSSPSPVSPQVESYRKTGEKHISPRVYR